jgi:uncharacterized protein YkwD
MKKQGLLFTGITLLTLFFLLTACTDLSAKIPSGDGSSSGTSTPQSGVHTPTAMPANNMTLPPQKAPPSPTATATPKTQTPAPTSGGTVGQPSVSQAAQAVLVLINQERATMKLPALQMSSALINSAHLHNLGMLAANQLSHQLPGEAALGTRITAQGVTWTFAAENIGYGFGDATKTAVSLNQSMFAEKPPDDGHRQNILSNATIIGIDVIVNPQNSQVWLTEDFAHPA